MVVISLARPIERLSRERLRGLQRVAVAHFAERYSLFVIICLGESIVAIGAGAAAHLTAGIVAAAVLGIALAAALWWVYFDVVALVSARRLARAERPPPGASAQMRPPGWAPPKGRPDSAI